MSTDDGNMFAGRVALVTGGGRGIGRAIAQALAVRGAAVAVNYRRDAESAAQTVDDIVRAGGTASAFQGDVSSWDEDVALVGAVREQFGPVDLLVNNGGIASRGSSIADTEPEELVRQLGVHALGSAYLSKLVVPEMRGRHRGDVVMVSSIAVDAMSALGGPYNMAKAAMEALARTLAKEEVVHGIHVNVVVPGLTSTAMGKKLVKATRGVDIADLDETSPFGRVCRPEDIADVVVFLCSDQAGYVTGQRLVVDGGAGSYHA